jgi:hypothetical protein
MHRILILFLILPTVIMAQNIQSAERPSLKFMNKSYRLVDFRKDGVKYIEEYLPNGEVWEDFKTSVVRHEYYSVADFNAAAQSKIWDLQEKVGKFPYELNVDEENKLATLNVAYWWDPRPGVLEKRAIVFAVDPLKKDVVAYEYHERHFVAANDDNFATLKETDKKLLLGDKFLESLKELSKTGF